MRGYGPRPEEWANGITKQQLISIRKRAYPPNRRTVGSMYEVVLERDMRALLAELDRIKGQK